ncbi:hypothetical protein EVG20_g10890 [Dentipellis fragilis]|uniref:Uncharacterized protein n=1 Tax=Dentipellis fragilis TaxID=205917 RepID=A0A4Y9XQM7_9AGAM|nr:hypothetical protein EVG20_g10890 [Dentipellis fragilis]
MTGRGRGRGRGSCGCRPPGSNSQVQTLAKNVLYVPSAFRLTMRLRSVTDSQSRVFIDPHSSFLGFPFSGSVNPPPNAPASHQIYRPDLPTISQPHSTSRSQRTTRLLDCLHAIVRRETVARLLPVDGAVDELDEDANDRVDVADALLRRVALAMSHKTQRPADITRHTPHATKHETRNAQRSAERGMRTQGGKCVTRHIMHGMNGRRERKARKEGRK